MVKQNNNVLLMVGLVIVVAVIASLITTGITANTIYVKGAYNPANIKQVYTKAEIDNLMKKVYNEINDTKDRLVDRMRAAEVVSFSDSIAPTNCVSVCEARHKSCNIAISEYASCPASEITCPANNVALKTIKDKSVISCEQSFQTGVLNNMSKSLSCVCI